MIDLRSIAIALGGEVVRGGVLAPGPGHSRADRSLSVRLSHQSPDGFIVFSHAGDSFSDCKDHVRDRLGLARERLERTRRRESVPAEASRRREAQPTDAGRIARAVAIWNEATDPRGTIVEYYLASRGLELPEDVAGAVIRYHPTCPWREGEVTARVPAMVAAMREVDGDTITAIQRTRLTPDGRKVDRRMLGIAAGAAVKLDADATVTTGLAIGEGIETALSGRLLGFRPAWAMGSAGGIAKLPVLPGVEALTILTERDETGANERATTECAERWHAVGREVILVEPRTGNDVNDALLGAA